jgi:hypothetical protein
VAAMLLCVGCASVKSTAIYYTPTTLEVFPPKPKDYRVPILEKAPDRRHRTIGKFAFETALGYRFARDAILYNARVNGADAVILKNVSGRRELYLTRVPARVDYVPTGGYYGGYGYGGFGYRSYYPIYQPGYVRADEAVMTSVHAEMIRVR